MNVVVAIEALGSVASVVTAMVVVDTFNVVEFQTNDDTNQKATVTLDDKIHIMQKI